MSGLCEEYTWLGGGSWICEVTGESGSGIGLVGSKDGEIGMDEATTLPFAMISFSVCGSMAGKPVGGGRFSSVTDFLSGGRASADVLAMLDKRRALTSSLELW